MAIVAVSVAPAGVGTSLSEYVARAVRIALDDPRVTARLDPMFTTLEGDLDDCLDVARKMHEAMFEAGAQRASTIIKIDDRRDRAITMDGKLKAVESKLDGKTSRN